MFKFPQKQPVGQTIDLILRPITQADLKAYAILNSNQMVMAAYGVSTHKTLSDTMKLINELSEAFLQERMVRWGVYLLSEPDVLIGDVGFWRFVPSRFRAEAGAKLLPQYHSRGLMKQALGEAIRMGFEDFQLNSIEGNIDPKNKSSLRLVEKLGFHTYAILPENSYDPVLKKFTDTVLVTLTKTQWLQNQNAKQG